VWDSPEGRGVRELDRALVVIGRDAGSDLVLDDATVSRRHALVQVDHGVKVTDLRSTAGTRINGAKLKPDVPCTLEPGDFLQVGKIVLSFHAVTPPPAPPSPPPARRSQPPVASIGIGIAFVAVAGLGALLAFVERKEPPPPPPPAEVVREPEPVPEPELPLPVEEPAPPPAEPPKPAAPERAVAGELPPREPATDLPDLIEVDGKTYLPARLQTLGAEGIEVIGADGRLYAIAAKRVTKIEDRADLARRFGVERRRLAPGDVAGRVALAEWCAARLLRDEARALVREALSLLPEDAAARALHARLLEEQ
jgi:hypothetical protein